MFLAGFEVVEAGLATHLVAAEKLGQLEERLQTLSCGDLQDQAHLERIFSSFQVRLPRIPNDAPPDDIRSASNRLPLQTHEDRWIRLPESLIHWCHLLSIPPTQSHAVLTVMH